MCHASATCVFFFFNDTATTEIYTLSLHDALPILGPVVLVGHDRGARVAHRFALDHPALLSHLVLLDIAQHEVDRKSTRLNSSHLVISYAVFCLKKKNGSTTGCAKP